MEIISLLQKFRAFPFFNRRCKDRLNIFISLPARQKGGGSNTFSYNFNKWIAKNRSKYNIVYNIGKADRAIVIANKMDIKRLAKAKDKGCFIIHRLDEHVEPVEDEYRRKKHAHIKELNRFADITVFQSNFVFENMYPFLDRPEKYEIIHNGADPEEFYPDDQPGKFIGHVTWGTGGKKRLDMLYETIRANPEERFLLVGNHSASKYNFTDLANVNYAGTVKRQQMPFFLHKMKFLYFPSENDPCPNTVIEAILAGVPVCYNPLGGTKELVKDCGTELSGYQDMNANIENFRTECLKRTDLHFYYTAERYLEL
ncbi:glycosyl transferases group 1 [bacterium BMS3Bbin08]|nr:glycosyl transferases group 1 [bacterium BMS3Bbin08]